MTRVLADFFYSSSAARKKKPVVVKKKKKTMEIIYTELALYGSKNECARTDNVYFTIFEVCDGTVSLESKLEANLVSSLFKCY